MTSTGTFTAAPGTATFSAATLPLDPLSTGLNGAYTVTFNQGSSSGAALGAVSGTLLFTSPLTLTLANAGAVYGPGQTVPLSFTAASPVAISSATLAATVKNQLTGAVYSSTTAFSVAAATATSVYWNLPLPAGGYSIVKFSNGQFTANVDLDVVPAASIDQIQSFEASSPGVIDTTHNPDFTGLSDLTQLSSTPFNRPYAVTDVHGNAVGIDASFSANFGNIGFASHASTSSGAPGDYAFDDVDGVLPSTGPVSVFSYVLFTQPWTAFADGECNLHTYAFTGPRCNPGSCALAFPAYTTRQLPEIGGSDT